MSEEEQETAGVQPAAETVACKACEKTLRAGLSKCPHCGYPQYDVEQCRICREYIPAGARRCVRCNADFAPQPRFKLSAAVLPYVTAMVSVISVTLTAVIPQCRDFINRNSRTSIAFQSDAEKVLNVTVLNSGLAPSTLRKYRLDFADDLAIEDADLELESGSPIVPKGGTVTIALKPRFGTLVTKTPHDELPHAIARKNVTLRLYVAESNDARNGPWTELTEQLAAPQIERFILTNTLEIQEEPQ